jgi:V/A-type H+-transporting ATPase subunit I
MDQTCVCIMTHKKDHDAVLATLRRMSFTAPADPTKHPPEVRIGRLKKRIDEASSTIEDSRKKLRDYAEKLDDLYFLSDYMIMRREKYDMLGRLLFSKKTFILDGFVAAEDLAHVEEVMTSKFDLFFDSRDPLPDEEVPAKFKNNAFVSPVEDIVESYSAPCKTDIDPNPVMSFFYYFFFGMMLSDAGYGILLCLGTLFVLLKRKPEGNNKKNMMKFFYCGLATTFWGFMYGSFFGDLVGAVSRGFFDGSVELPPIWFDPSKDPMKLLILSFLLGFLHICIGLGANFYRMWKNGDKVGAICDVGFWYLAFAGIVIIIFPMVAPMMAPVAIPASIPFGEIGKYVALAGVAGLVLTGGRNAKGFVGKAIGGVGTIYGVTGYFSDLLSYSRLMALGLVTGIIGSVANMIGTLFGTGIVKLLIFIFVFLFFHAINLGISALGAYVHVNRLQYVEFFAKFYDGGGIMFHPFTGNTKHFKIKEDN